jgi:hypothetical protein
MRDQFSPALDLRGLADTAPDRELNELLATHPWLEDLQPFYVDWEMIWLM